MVKVAFSILVPLFKTRAVTVITVPGMTPESWLAVAESTAKSMRLLTTLITLVLDAATVVVSVAVSVTV